MPEDIEQQSETSAVLPQKVDNPLTIKFPEVVQKWHERTLDRLFNRELKPGEPAVDFHIFYGDHRTYEDLHKLQDAFANTDVFIPEVEGWSKHREWLQKLATGEISPDDIYRGLDGNPKEIWNFMLNLVYKSHKAITLVDLPADNPIYKELLQHKGESLLDLHGSLKQNVDSLRNIFQAEAEHSAKREEYMVAQLKPCIEELLMQNPELVKQARRKGSLQVLMFLGANHTGVSHILEQSGVNISREFSTSPFTYGHYDEILRAYRFGKEVSDDTMERIVLDIMLRNVFGQLENVTNNSEKVTEYYRKLNNEFTAQEISSIYRKIKGKGNLAMKRTLYEVIKNKNIQIPATIEQLNNFLVSSDTTSPKTLEQFAQS